VLDSGESLGHVLVRIVVRERLSIKVTPKRFPQTIAGMRAKARAALRRAGVR